MPDVTPVIILPTFAAVEVDVLSNLTNSYALSIFKPPGFTTAPSLKMLLPNLSICFWMIVCI